MADAIGPNRYLPGQIIRTGHLVTEYYCDCDDCKKPAAGAVIGETDSFGSEVEHFCTKHLAEYEERLSKVTDTPLVYCDHCKTDMPDVKPMRDPAEGSTGPVYYLCAKHRKALIDDF